MFDDNAKDPSAFAFACKSVALRVSTKWIFSLTFQEGVLLLPTGSWLRGVNKWGAIAPPHILAEKKAPPGTGGNPH